MYIQEQKKDNYEWLHTPLQTRQDVQRGHGRFLNSRYQRYPELDRLLFKRSFGLCGIPLEVYWDGQDAERSFAALWAFRKERFGIGADEKCCVFSTAEYAGNKIMDYMPRYLSWDKKTLSFPMLDLSLERMKEWVDDISAFHPAWMRIPPSVAVMLAETMKLSGQMSLPGLRYIELSGEMLDEKTELMLREAFQAQISNVYATQETGPIAASCTYGNLHIFSENVALQVIRDGKSVMDEEGDIYVTSLQNNAMPLVRLKTGDKGVLLSKSCSCGQSAPVLRLTKGRDCSFIVTVSGRKISAFMLRSLAEYANEEVSRCLEHIQFRQTGCDSMDVILGVKPAFSGWEGEIARVLRRQIQDMELKQMQWNFIFVDSCASEKSEIEKRPFFAMNEGVVV